MRSRSLPTLLLILSLWGISPADEQEIVVKAQDGLPAQVYQFDQQARTQKYLGETEQPITISRKRIGDHLVLDLILSRQEMANTYNPGATFRRAENFTSTLTVLERHFDIGLRMEPSTTLSFYGKVPAGLSLSAGKLHFDSKDHLTMGVLNLAQGLTFKVSAPGYLPTEISLNQYNLLHQSYPLPDEDTIYLQAQSGFYPWYQRTRQERPWLLALLLAVPLVVPFGWKRYKKNREELAYAASVLQVKADSSDPLVGSLLAKYRILERIGSGGMASVYRAVPDQQKTLENIVALKVIRRELAETEDFLKRFYREARVAQELVHPGIIETYDAGKENGLLYMAMELVEGRELKELIREGLPLATGLKYLAQIAGAVNYAHSKEIIHRDLKPGNVMVTNTGEVKVLDFGLARSQEMSTMTATGNILGTPAYLPPENLKGLKATSAVDQYSLGVLAYETATGRLPFEDERVEVLMVKHLTEEAAPPSSLNPEVPKWLDTMILKMMAKEPEERYASLADIVELLQTHTV